MNDGEPGDDLSQRVAETVRHALALVGPADSTTAEHVAEVEQPVS